MRMPAFNVPGGSVLFLAFLRLHDFMRFLPAISLRHAGLVRAAIGADSHLGVDALSLQIGGLHACGFRVRDIGMEVNRQADRLTKTQEKDDKDPTGSKVD